MLCTTVIHSFMLNYFYIWNKSHLMMVYNPFNMLPDFFSQTLLNIFSSICIQNNKDVNLFYCKLFIWPWCQGNVGAIVQSSSVFYNSLKVCVNSSIIIWWKSSLKPNDPELIFFERFRLLISTLYCFKVVQIFLFVLWFILVGCVFPGIFSFNLNK